MAHVSDEQEVNVYYLMLWAEDQTSLYSQGSRAQGAAGCGGLEWGGIPPHLQLRFRLSDAS